MKADKWNNATFAALIEGGVGARMVLRALGRGWLQRGQVGSGKNWWAAENESHVVKKREKKRKEKYAMWTRLLPPTLWHTRLVGTPFVGPIKMGSTWAPHASERSQSAGCFYQQTRVIFIFIPNTEYKHIMCNVFEKLHKSTRPLYVGFTIHCFGPLGYIIFIFLVFK